MTHSYHETIAQLTRAFAFPISAYDGLVDQFIKELDEGLRVEGAMVKNTPLLMLSRLLSFRIGFDMANTVVLIGIMVASL